MITVNPPMRNDNQGLGHFGASRGHRIHNGVDYAVAPEAAILSPVEGTVTKLGYPYANGYGGVTPNGDEPVYRYVEITSRDQKRHRLFYVRPLVQVSQGVTKGRAVAVSMDVSERYPGMTPHVHYEIMLPDGTFIDPEQAL